MKSSLPTSLLIDGNSLLNTYYYGTLPKEARHSKGEDYFTRLERDAEGRYINAIKPFMQAVKRLSEALCAAHTEVCFDSQGPTFRSFTETYKGSRDSTPEPLLEQLQYAKVLLREAGYSICERYCFEGDDILASLARQESAYARVRVVTTDHDMLQIVDDRIKVILFVSCREKLEAFRQKWPDNYLFGKYCIYGERQVKAEEGVEPEMIPDLKSLKGDRSDNIFGIRGVGKKEAPTLLNIFGSTEQLVKKSKDGEPEEFISLMDQAGLPVKSAQSVLRNGESLKKGKWMATTFDQLSFTMPF